MICNFGIYNHLSCLLKAATSLTKGSNQQRQAAVNFDVSTKQVGEMTGNEKRPFLQSRIMIPIRLCSLPIHSPCLSLLIAIG